MKIMEIESTLPKIPDGVPNHSTLGTFDFVQVILFAVQTDGY